MIVKTKRFSMETNDYVRMAMTNVLKELWWVFAVPIVIVAMTFVLPSHWWWISALIITVLYFLFWIVQFIGVTQLEQFKIMFDKVSYEISSQQILMKVNAKQGMPIRWETIKSVKSNKDSFVFILSKAQLIHMPHKMFANTNDIKFVESILKRKELVK